jgi:hypothetical protein
MTVRMTLEQGSWYGWTMFPGYFNTPYHSPIKVSRIEPLRTGRGLFTLHFYNMGYAEGVRNMAYELRTLRREQHHILAAVENSDRSVAIVPLNRQWFTAHGVQLSGLRQLLEQGLTLGAAMDRLVRSEPVTRYGSC